MNEYNKKPEDILKKNKSLIQERFKVSKIGFFGSYTRGEQNQKSDVDILVEFSKPVGFFEFLELELFLEKMLDKKVDLVTKKALKKVIGNHILQKVSYI